MEAAGAFEVQSSNFVPTELTNVIDHFLCRICNFVVWQPKECPKCNSVYCHTCQQKLQGEKGMWQCKECTSKEPVTEMHRTVKDVLDMLVF